MSENEGNAVQTIDIKANLPQAGKVEPDQLMVMALQQGADVSVLERLMDLAERHQAQQAKMAFDEALSRFKADPPTVKRNKHVSYGNTDYWHATLDHIVDVVSPALSACGLSFNWTTTQNESGVSVTCKLSHVMGHSMETTLFSAPDDSGKKNAIQAVGSAVSYLQRYTLMALLGMAASDDDDGQASEQAETIDGDQADVLHTIIREVQDAGDEKFGTDALTWLFQQGFDSVEDITVARYEEMVRGLTNAATTRMKLMEQES